MENTKIMQDFIPSQEFKRVAAYCRVSTNSDEQLKSLAAQREHYQQYISNHPGWELAGIYYDEGITGTKKNKRPELLHLLKDCEAHQVDLVITKSISRLARNAADCLDIVRQLKDLGIPVIFERENLNTANMDDEFILTVLSSMAESESNSISANNRWSIQSRMTNGYFKVSTPPYGYDRDFEIIPDDAKVVKQIFTAFLNGKSSLTIAKDLTAPSPSGGKWSDSTIRSLLRNETYTGDLRLQKTYTDHSFNRHVNHDEDTMTWYQDHHDPIISLDEFDRTQSLLAKRAKHRNTETRSLKYRQSYLYSGKLICQCGAKFKRQKKSKRVTWSCQKHIKDSQACPIKPIDERQIEVAFTTMINKLIFSKNKLLNPYLQGLRNEPENRKYRRMKELEESILLATEKRDTLMTMLSQDLIEPNEMMAKTKELIVRSNQYRQELSKLRSTFGKNDNLILATRELLNYVNNHDIQATFDEQLFKQTVDNITVQDNSHLTFNLFCGLSLSERIWLLMSTVTFGYRISNGKIEIDPVNGKRVKNIFKDYLNAKTLTGVALNNGFKFHGAVKRILVNQTYLGTDDYPQLISHQIFEQVQTELKNRAIQLGRTNLPSHQMKFYAQTKFKFNRSHHRYRRPNKQAEYMYQLIESEES